VYCASNHVSALNQVSKASPPSALNKASENIDLFIVIRIRVNQAISYAGCNYLVSGYVDFDTESGESTGYDLYMDGFGIGGCGDMHFYSLGITDNNPTDGNGGVTEASLIQFLEKEL
jgi:hypothetical protein